MVDVALLGDIAQAPNELFGQQCPRALRSCPSKIRERWKVFLKWKHFKPPNLDLVGIIRSGLVLQDTGHLHEPSNRLNSIPLK